MNDDDVTVSSLVGVCSAAELSDSEEDEDMERVMLT